jgi:hypothetical protein
MFLNIIPIRNISLPLCSAGGAVETVIAMTPKKKGAKEGRYGAVRLLLE